MEKDMINALHTVKAVFKLIFKVCPSIKYIFKGSFVRKIASLLPLRPASRIHINLPLCSTPYGSFYEDNYFPSMHKENSTFYVSISSPHISSTPLTQQAKITELEYQLKELQDKVAQIMLQIPTSDYDTESTVSNWLANQNNFASVATSIPPPPPPPPPPSITLPPPPPPLPPPMPSQDFLLYTPKRILKTPGKQVGITANANKSPTSMLGDVIQQITNNRPKLKPIKRSPGGNPLKTPKLVVDDPSDILSKVLRRRFSALHSQSDSFNENLDQNDSLQSQIFSCASSPASAI